MEDGTCRVTYCPTEPGNYIVSIRFAEEHVPGRGAKVAEKQFVQCSNEACNLTNVWRQQEVRSQ